MEHKHPVSVLQELMAQQHKILPSYEIADISHPNRPRFRCTVKADGIVDVAEASQKQTAKREAAMRVLSKLQHTKITYSGTKSSFPASITYNAVGKLNEYTAQKRLPYPSYNEYGVNTNGEFIIKCTVLHNVSEGIASTKKAAKQLAAHHMLNNLEGRNLSEVSEITSLSLDRKFDEEHDKIVLEKFEKLSVNTPKVCMTEKIQEVGYDESKVHLDEIKVEDASYETLEDMIEELKQLNISYSIDVIHRNPYVLLLRLDNGSNTTVVESGDTYQETHRSLIRKALTVLTVLNSDNKREV